MFGRTAAKGKFPATFSELKPEHAYNVGFRDAVSRDGLGTTGSHPTVMSTVEPATVRVMRRLADEVALSISARFLHELSRIEQTDEGPTGHRQVESGRRDARARFAKLEARFLLLVDAYAAGELAGRRSAGDYAEPGWREGLLPLRVPEGLDEQLVSIPYSGAIQEKAEVTCRTARAHSSSRYRQVGSAVAGQGARPRR